MFKMNIVRIARYLCGSWASCFQIYSSWVVVTCCNRNESNFVVCRWPVRGGRWTAAVSWQGQRCSS